MRLFDPFTQRGLTLRNRIAVTPMCQYSAQDSLPNTWHLVHLGSRAVGGAGAVLSEAAAVLPEGRISPQDAGLWHADQTAAWQPITAFIKAQGAVPGVQLAHAGRKAATRRPWEGTGPVAAAEGWPVVAPSALTYKEGWQLPQALDAAGLRGVVAAFRAAAVRALEAGFELVEIHAAHGYLLHQFLSPLTNRRDDAWGGSFGNRTRLTREVVAAVREVWPERLPLWLCISATDWVEGGWSVAESVALAAELAPLGVDLVDVSSGGLVPDAVIVEAPGYQVPFAARIRREAGIATAAVGRITDARQADAIIAAGQADLVLVGREALRDPYFPRRAAAELGVAIPAPAQYLRAW